MSVRLLIVDEKALQPYIQGLKDLEAGIEYPIEGGADHFTIHHGQDYSPFFTNRGKARFLVALEKDRVVGSCAAIWRETQFEQRKVMGLYLADLKLSHRFRGTGLARRLVWWTFLRWPFVSDYKGWDFAFFAAMGGAKGDVKRTFGGVHLGRMTAQAARLRVYFLPPATLVNLPDNGPSQPQALGVQLSPDHGSAINWNKGTKDFLLHSTQKPWELAHLPPLGHLGPDLGKTLRDFGQILHTKNPESLACFALDEKLSGHHKWLTQHGLETTTICTIYAVSFFAPSLRKYPHLHMSTADI